MDDQIREIYSGMGGNKDHDKEWNLPYSLVKIRFHLKTQFEANLKR